MKTVRFTAGFTLIELLIVMAIIGVLATLASVNFISVRERSRDSQRKSDLVQLQTSLELYHTDAGTYPTTAIFQSFSCNNPITYNTATYLKEMPCDPSTNAEYQFLPDATASTYKLYACLENKNDKAGTATNPGGTACSSAWYYVVENP
jgi:general secretion pathway protein G